jgi:hypothetical protein
LCKSKRVNRRAKRGKDYGEMCKTRQVERRGEEREEAERGHEQSGMRK